MHELKPVDQQLTVIDEKGNEVLCQILFTFESDVFNKKYVVFYSIEDYNSDNNDMTVMAASYTDGEDGVGELAEITEPAEWDLVEEVLHQFEDSMDEEDGCNCCEGECDDEECEACHHECHHEE